ncbi:MAG: type VI secretion system baseplate subunit TssF [Desulfosalsimonadaceae bacterium]
MLHRYFQQELDHLRDLGQAFSKAHPAVAPMLSGSSTDPDVERLLEGVAFLTALLREKLDDEFPEIIHELVQLIWPHYLRPVPSAAIVAFSPKPTLKQSITVPAGAQLASVPVDATPCLFRTCFETVVHPLRVLEAGFLAPAGQPPAVVLKMRLNGPPLSDWQPGFVRFFMGGDYAAAADLFFLLQKHLQYIELIPSEKGRNRILPSDCLRPVGFQETESLFPYPSNSFPAYRILQEYFILPQKFLFLDLTGWQNWINRGEGNDFTIRFVLENPPFTPGRVRAANFVLGATPVINIFSHEADPFRLDHRKTDYEIRPAGSNVNHYQVYSVDRVAGFVQGSAKEKTYVPFELFSAKQANQPVYYTKLRRSPIGSGFNVLLSFAYPDTANMPQTEIISVKVQCTNGSLPEGLQIGDISHPTSSSPEFVDFTNITVPTNNVLPPIGSNLLWRFLSHLSLNYLSLSRPENLRTLLELYIFEETRDKTSIIANRKRIAGIEALEAAPSNRMVAGVMMRGLEVRMKIRQDHFVGAGDLYLFGNIMDFFFGNYASINTYTRMAINEAVKGDVYQWPARVGLHPLI